MIAFWSNEDYHLIEKILKNVYKHQYAYTIKCTTDDLTYSEIRFETIERKLNDHYILVKKRFLPKRKSRGFEVVQLEEIENHSSNSNEKTYNYGLRNRGKLRPALELKNLRPILKDTSKEKVLKYF